MGMREPEQPARYDLYVTLTLDESRVSAEFWPDDVTPEIEALFKGASVAGTIVSFKAISNLRLSEAGSRYGFLMVLQSFPSRIQSNEQQLLRFPVQRKGAARGRTLHVTGKERT